MKSLGVIPARYDSSRFPGKPCCIIAGKPMIQHVYERSLLSSLDTVIVATDDQRIFDTVESFGGQAIMTRADHLNGTTRVAEVAEQYEDMDIIVNIQGDEPLIEPTLITRLVQSFTPETVMASVRCKINSPEDITNPHCVKVVCDAMQQALYFSRSPIPYNHSDKSIDYWKHIGLYAYRRSFLFQYIDLRPTPLELAESLEQLRVLENGFPIMMVDTVHESIGVDTPEDVIRVEELLQEAIKNENT